MQILAQRIRMGMESRARIRCAAREQPIASSFVSHDDLIREMSSSAQSSFVNHDDPIREMRSSGVVYASPAWARRQSTSASQIK